MGACYKVSLIRISGSLIPFDAAGCFIRHASLARSLGMNDKWVELQIIFWQAPSDQLVFANLNVGPLLVDIGDVFNQFVPQNEGIQPGLLNDDGSRGSAYVSLGYAIADRQFVPLTYRHRWRPVA